MAAHGTQTIADRVRQVVIDTLEIEPGRVETAALLSEDLGADSLDWTEVAIELGDAFEIEIDDEQMPITVGDLIALVRSRVEGR